MSEAKRILLVEDNPADEALTLRALRKSGIASEVQVARDGVEALEILHGTGAHADRPRMPLPVVVLLDLNLPRLDGFEVLKQVRADERTRFVPVVMLTSSKEDEDIVRSFENGANAYVRKPVEFHEFAAAVNAIGEFWLLLNQRAGV